MVEPRRVTFVTSPDRCNLRCRMCREHSPLAPEPPGDERLLPFELVARVVRERRGRGLLEVIPSTAGEPLLWPGFEALVELCLAEGVPLNVTTNGTFPRGGPARWAPRLARAASDVKVSWNGARAGTAERIMEGLSFEAALAGVRALVRARDALRARGERACRVSFQTTAQEANVGELPDLVRLAASLGVERVKLNQLQVHHRALADDDLRRDQASRARWNAAVEGVLAAAAATGVAVEGAAPMEGEPSRAPLGPCPFLGREAWVRADGRFAPCPAPHGPADDLGSLVDRTLGEIWGSAEYRALALGYEARPECAGCPFRRPGGL